MIITSSHLCRVGTVRTLLPFFSTFRYICVHSVLIHIVFHIVHPFLLWLPLPVYLLSWSSPFYLLITTFRLNGITVTMKLTKTINSRVLSYCAHKRQSMIASYSGTFGNVQKYSGHFYSGHWIQFLGVVKRRGWVHRTGKELMENIEVTENRYFIKIVLRYLVRQQKLWVFHKKVN